ncbi:MAG TPA: ABC transporter permease [Acidobacteriota bacterium]|nr:ABC transporter permease [Acidobacteriota bacterium]
MVIHFSVQRVRLFLRQSFYLAKTTLSQRYEKSYLGVFWFLLEPLLYFLIFLTIKKSLNIQIENYPIYILVGILVYNFFSHMTTQSLQCISNNKEIIKHFKVSSETLVFSVALQVLFFHFFELIILVGFMVYFGLPLQGLIGYILILILFVPFCLGVSFFISAITAYIADFISLWRLFLLSLLFVLPIFYAIPLPISSFNPLYYFVTFFRETVLNQLFPSFWTIGLLFCMSVASLALGLLVFRSLKKKFAELA